MHLFNHQFGPQQRKCESTILKLNNYGSLNHNKSVGDYYQGGLGGGGLLRHSAVPVPAKTSALPEETRDLITADSEFPLWNVCL